MISALYLVLFIGCVEAYNVHKYINPCGAIYSSVKPDVHGVKKVFHHMKPQLMEIIHILKNTHLKCMEGYKYKKTWIPDENSIIITNNALNSAKQLPEIYRNLQYFSYALDVIKEDTLNSQTSEDCFCDLDELPTIIAKHQQLICLVDVSMGQLGIEVPAVRQIDLPQDWANPPDDSCTHKLFRLAEVHTKYRKFLHGIFHLAHV